jgi:predicted RNA polymerase sigma factor
VLLTIPEGALAGYPFLAAARGEMHRRAGHHMAAADQYRKAIDQSRSPAEAELFRQRLASCEG